MNFNADLFIRETQRKIDAFRRRATLLKIADNIAAITTTAAVVFSLIAVIKEVINQ